MEKIAFTLLMVLNLTFFPNSASAQAQPLACQVEKAAGLKWESGRWVTSSFVTNKFILVQTEQTLTNDSVAKAFSPDNPFPKGISCSSVFSPNVSCINSTGASLFFDFKLLKGAIAKTYGSTMSGADYRDTVTVEVFSCTPF